MDAGEQVTETDVIVVATRKVALPLPPQPIADAETIATKHRVALLPHSIVKVP
jgi:hypothetical protein